MLWVYVLLIFFGPYLKCFAHFGLEILWFGNLERLVFSSDKIAAQEWQGRPPFCVRLWRKPAPPPIETSEKTSIIEKTTGKKKVAVKRTKRTAAFDFVQRRTTIKWHGPLRPR
jgi:hypothetical protein